MPSLITLTGPGTATIVDDAAAAIVAQTAAQTAASGLLLSQIILINGAIVQINSNVTRLADMSKSISSSVYNLNIAIGSLSAATSSNNALQSVMAANQIQTNNFQVQATKEALERTDQPVPTMPPIKDQLTTAVRDAVSFGTAVRASSLVTDQINHMVSELGVWIAGTAVYQTIGGWLKSAKDSILTIEIPSATTIASKIKALLPPSA